MQPPSFWRNLEARFRGLADPVWADTDAPARLHLSDGKVRGGDASLRARFKNVAALGGMALCADRGFGANVFDGVWMWEDAVTAYLKEEKNPWYTECRSTRWKPGPAEKQELALSAIRPRHDEPHYTVDEALLFDEWVERIQREGMNVLLIVTADDHGYVVIDDEHEDLKYRACVRAGVTSLTCDVRSASNPGAMEDALVDTIDCISVASADLCGRLETEAFGREIAPPVERPATRPDGSATPAPVATPLTRRARVDDFLTPSCPGSSRLPHEGRSRAGPPPIALEVCCRRSSSLWRKSVLPGSTGPILCTRLRPMAMGTTRDDGSQQAMWVATADLVRCV